METNENNTVEVKEHEGTGEASTQTTENSQTEGKADVESEAQKIANIIVAKKMKGMPSKEELKAFKEWRDSQKTEAEKQQETIKENEALKNRIAELENMNVVANAGVDTKFQKFVFSEVSSIKGDFEENLEQYLKENSQFLTKQETDANASKTTGVAVNKITTDSQNGVTAILKAKHPELYEK